MRRPALRILSFGLVCLAGVAFADRDEDNLKRWIDGPIRYIALKDEVRAFKSLDNDRDRALFVEKFWSRRDPTPETLVNEYRQIFWERVQQANSNFLDSTKPGSMTDRGKIHILYGPPTEIQEDLHLSGKGSSTSGRGVIRWIYEGRPEQRQDLNPIVVVPFERHVDGEYRVSYNPKLASVFFDATAIAEDRDGRYDRFFELVSAPTRSQISVMLDLGRMQEIPPQEKVLLERVETMESYQTLPLRVKIDNFQQPDEQRPIASINVDLASVAAATRPAIIARFVPLNVAGETRLLGEDSFRVEDHESYRMAQARLALDPGEYAVTVIVADPVQIRTGVYRGRATIPRPPLTLRFSDTIWAAELEPIRYAAAASHREPFYVGPFRVLPKLDPVYRRGESIKLFFEVYGAEYPVRITYQLEGMDDDGSWLSLGQPSVTEQSAAGQAWELPTGARWPLGEYRVRVEVQDAADRLLTTQVPFTLVSSDSS